MSVTRLEQFDLPLLLTELIEHTLTFLTEQEVLWFAQTSKTNTNIAHRVLFSRGMSHWLWRKLLAAATMQPDLMPLNDTLVLQRTHQPRDNIFDEAARALFLLAKTNRQVVISDRWIDELLSFYLHIYYYRRFAAGNILSVLIPIMTDTQFANMFFKMFYKKITSPHFRTSSLEDYATNLLQLMVMRLNPQQLIDCSKKGSILDMMDVAVGAEHAARVFNNIVHPFLTSPEHKHELGYFYGFGERPKLFLKLYPHLSVELKQLAVSDVRLGMQYYDKRVAQSAYQLMQHMAPEVLSDKVKAGAEKLRQHLAAPNVLIKWQPVFNEFAAMAASLTPLHLEPILPLMVPLFTAWPNHEIDHRTSFEDGGLTLFGEVASCMSNPQATMALSVVQHVLDRHTLLATTQNHALFALAPLLRRVDAEKRTLHINRILNIYLHDLSDIEYALNVIMALAQDMSETEAESIFPKLQRQLLHPPRSHNDRDLGEVAKDAFTALIPRLSKDGLLRWITTWNGIPWLFLRCLYLRMHDLDNDVLMHLMPQVIGWLDDRPEDTGLSLSNMAQTILVSFTSRPYVTLQEDLLLLIHKILKANPFKAAPYNVWCHLMKLGKYDLHSLNTSLPRDHAGLNQLIHLIEAASSNEPAAPPLVSQAPQPSSASVVSSGLSFFTIIPRQNEHKPSSTNIAPRKM